MQDAKNRQKFAIWAPSYNFVGPYLCNEGTINNREKHGKQQYIRWRVCGTPVNFNGFRVLAALLHGTLAVGVSQTLRC